MSCVLCNRILTNGLSTRRSNIACREHIKIISKWVNLTSFILKKAGLLNKYIRIIIIKLSISEIPPNYKCLECAIPIGWRNMPLRGYCETHIGCPKCIGIGDTPESYVRVRNHPKSYARLLGSPLCGSCAFESRICFADGCNTNIQILSQNTNGFCYEHRLCISNECFHWRKSYSNWCKSCLRKRQLINQK